jgi:hypothetical protein
MRSSYLSRAFSALALLGAFFASGCDRAADVAPSAGRPAVKPGVAVTPLPKPPQARYQRDLYGKLDDCVLDWGSAAKCIPVAADASERAQGAAFLGPIYSNGLRFESQLTARREAVEQGYQRQLDENPTNKAIASAEIRS